MREERMKDGELLDMLRMMAPGTALREGLDNILRARTGALIVIGDSKEVLDVVNGGFYINKEFSHSSIYELAKMDGAIIISKDLKRILYANALLIPDPSIESNETGTRHKSAERVAKQTGELVICISQRRNVITLYKNTRKYILRETPIIIAKANQALQTLEKYKAVLYDTANKLSVLEFDDSVTLHDVAVVLQRTEMVMRVAAEIDRYICELGNEGRLVSMQLEELVANVEEEGLLVIEDYISPSMDKSPLDVLRQIRQYTYEELNDTLVMCRALWPSGGVSMLDMNVSARGYRILSKIPRLPMSITKNLIDRFNNLQGIMRASIEELDDVEGIGEVRARMIKDALRRAREQLFLDNRRI